jgi:hypothetical protein
MRPEFLNGPFAPWAEESEAYDLEVVGKIPEIAGTPKRAQLVLQRVTQRKHIGFARPMDAIERLRRAPSLLNPLDVERLGEMTLPGSAGDRRGDRHARFD